MEALVRIQIRTGPKRLRFRISIADLEALVCHVFFSTG